MNPLFLLLATAMLLVALACIALPLWRHARGRGAAVSARQHTALQQALDAGVISAEEFAAKRAQLDAAPAVAAQARSRVAFAALLASLLLLPPGAFALYRLLGEPRALDPANLGAAAAAQHGPDMEQAIAGLVAKLKQTPDDIEGWLLLGRAYKTTQRFAEARDALKQAYDRAGDNPDVLVEYAEAMALVSPTRQLEGEPRALLERALRADPAQQRGLWLLGIADFQASRWADAVTHWQALQAQLEPDSEVWRSVQTQIEQARAKGGLPATPPAGVAASAGGSASPGSAAPPTAAGAPRLTVQVSLAPELAAQVAADDVLFVFAKAASGPPMPLAVQRLRASDLPATVVLTDGMGMMPSMTLSQFPQVIVGARISKSGNAIAQRGDLQSLSAPLDVHRSEPLALRIDSRVN